MFVKLISGIAYDCSTCNDPLLGGAPVSLDLTSRRIVISSGFFSAMLPSVVRQRESSAGRIPHPAPMKDNSRPPALPFLPGEKRLPQSGLPFASADDPKSQTVLRWLEECQQGPGSRFPA